MMTLLKWPLIVAAMIVVIRVILEESGAPPFLSNVLGVSWLYLLMPVYFALRVAMDTPPRPYIRLFQLSALFVFFSRLMIMVTYSLAYVFNWSARRFSVEGGGVVGEGISALEGVVLIPVQSLAIGAVFGFIPALVIGSIVLAIRRRSAGAG